MKGTESAFWLRFARITTYDSLFKSEAAKYSLDWRQLKAISMIESWVGTYKGVVDTDEERANAPNRADSSDGLSAGLMQITLTTARDYDSSATFTKLQDPNYSVNIAARHLAKLKRIAPSTRTLEFIVKSYNQGQGNTAKEFATPNTTGYQAAKEYWAKYQSAIAAIG